VKEFKKIGYDRPMTKLYELEMVRLTLCAFDYVTKKDVDRSRITREAITQVFTWGEICEYSV